MNPLTREQILAVAGDLGDGAVAEIERLGATEAELLAAIASLEDEPSLRGASGHSLPGQAAAIQAILAAEQEVREPEEERRS